MKTVIVKTWKERPAMETSTATLLPPEEVEDKAPPTACRHRERMSQDWWTVLESVWFIHGCVLDFETGL